MHVPPLRQQSVQWLTSQRSPEKSGQQQHLQSPFSLARQRPPFSQGGRHSSPSQAQSLCHTSPIFYVVSGVKGVSWINIDASSCLYSRVNEKPNGDRMGLPETTASAQVPLTSTLPSGQVHLAPAGLRRHMKSQDILRHGFDAVEERIKMHF